VTDINPIDPAWSLAFVAEARAHRFADILVIQIAGETPDPSFSVDVERNLLEAEPLEFIAKWYREPLPCPQVVTPYEFHKAFRVGGERWPVRLHHAGGALDVSVNDIVEQDLPAELRVSEAGMAGLSHPLPVATGYSEAYDFAEAFRDAVGRLPDRGAGIPDWLETYKVVSIGAEIGGIAGFNHMYVMVQGG
jgi:hypothetical protein